jgi:hypothetical protein
MPFQDVINDYSNGSTGTLTDTNGDTVNYTVTGTSPTVDWHGLSDGARVNGTGTETFTVTFDSHVTGATMQVSGSDKNEEYFIVVDGVAVDLNTLIADGTVTLTQSGAATHVVNTDGSISGGHHNDDSILEIRFNTAVISLGAIGSVGGGGNWDYFEVGIDSTDFDVVCFTQGTLIRTAEGPCTVEELQVGDIIETATHGPQPIRWIGSKTVTTARLERQPQLRPIRIAAGALGRGLPQRDLLVSRQHRMLVSSPIAVRMFGTSDVLIPANKLTALPGIDVDERAAPVTYFHLLFDQHEVIFAENAPSESLYVGPETLKMIAPDALAEILVLFPELERKQPGFAFPEPSSKQQKQFVARHLKNAKPLLETSH